MSDISAIFPNATALVAIGGAYFLGTLAPVFASGFVVLRHRPAMPRPFLFVLTVTMLSYGILNFAGYVIDIPVAAYLMYVAPQLEASGHYASQPFTYVGAFVAQYWWVGFAPLLLIISILATRYLGKRWARIVEALG